MGKVIELKTPIRVDKDTVKLKMLADAVDQIIMDAYVEEGLEMREVLYILSDRLGKAANLTADPSLMVDLMSDLMYKRINESKDAD
jgi:hypothetical protein